jgi:hypothetical protein
VPGSVQALLFSVMINVSLLVTSLESVEALLYRGGIHVRDPLKVFMVFVTSARARRTGAASQAFERMHNTLSHRSNLGTP